ncbi:hypothetical protein AB0M43_00125 [Longispora sp. NPDC051575]|uniref:hypothetical protein n=1 Tax=Longispora sp. NPDC051575 TaxID=3154943 RepID=UPI003425967E
MSVPDGHERDGESPITSSAPVIMLLASRFGHFDQIRATTAETRAVTSEVPFSMA